MIAKYFSMEGDKMSGKMTPAKAAALAGKIISTAKKTGIPVPKK